MKRDKWRRCGQILRYTLFGVNFIPWVVAISSIIGGFVLGFETQLIQWPLRTEDFQITTPATAFVFYGAFMVLVTTFGCFSASSANRVVLILVRFILVGIVLFIWDSLVGISVFVDADSLEIFMERIQNSIHDYGNESAERLGLFRTTANELWDHMQERGKCCGYMSFEDWRKTTVGRNDSIPDACCKPLYKGHGCGTNVWSHHPLSTGRHSLRDVLIEEGCVSLWPEAFMNSLDSSGHFGVFVGVCFIICFLLALILLVIVCLKKYHPDWGVLSLQQKGLDRLSMAPEGEAGGDARRSRRRSRVGPESQSDKSPVLDRYLYKSAQINDEDADNYAPELKRRRAEGELYRGRRRSTVNRDANRDLELFAQRRPNLVHDKTDADAEMNKMEPDDELVDGHLNKKLRFGS